MASPQLFPHIIKSLDTIIFAFVVFPSTEQFKNCVKIIVGVRTSNYELIAIVRMKQCVIVVPRSPAFRYPNITGTTSSSIKYVVLPNFFLYYAYLYITCTLCVQLITFDFIKNNKG